MSEISEPDQQTYLERALKAADWYVNSQLNEPPHAYKPIWHADRGRFLYH